MLPCVCSVIDHGKRRNVLGGYDLLTCKFETITKFHIIVLVLKSNESLNTNSHPIAKQTTHKAHLLAQFRMYRGKWLSLLPGNDPLPLFRQVQSLRTCLLECTPVVELMVRLLRSRWRHIVLLLYCM